MKNKLFLLLAITTLALTSCTNNYSNGERIGYVCKFSNKGLIWKSWEGELNLTQTGMNTSSLFDFSVDNDNEDKTIVAQLDSAASLGWKVKLKYHEVAGYNWFSNRGHEDYFVSEVDILDRKPFTFNSNSANVSAVVPAYSIKGKTIDTIFVVIYRDKPVEVSPVKK